MSTTALKRNIFQRLFGIPATKLPMHEDCWTLSDGEIVIDLSMAPELSRPWGAIRLEKKDLPERVLVIRGGDDKFYAFRNRCKHMGRRVDPVPETRTVQCCSINKTTYDYEGRVLSGPANKSLELYEVQADNGKLIIRI